MDEDVKTLCYVMIWRYSRGDHEVVFVGKQYNHENTACMINSLKMDTDSCPTVSYSWRQISIFMLNDLVNQVFTPATSLWRTLHIYYPSSVVVLCSSWWDAVCVASGFVAL